MPFVFRAGFHPPLATVLLQILGLTLAGIFVGWLRLTSDSIWVASAMHAAHNSFYFNLFGATFRGPGAALWAGETGIFSIVAYGLAVLWLAKTQRLCFDRCRGELLDPTPPSRA